MSLLSTLLRFAASVAGSIALVTVVLLVAPPARDAAWSTVTAAWRSQDVESLLKAAQRDATAGVDETERRVGTLRDRGQEAVRERVRTIDRDLDELKGQPRLSEAGYFQLAKLLAQNELEAALRSEFSRRLLLQEQAVLNALLPVGQGDIHRLQSLRQQAVDEREEKAQLAARYRADKTCWIPFSPCSRKLSEAEARQREANQRAWGHLHEENRLKALPMRPVSGVGSPAQRIDRAELLQPFEAMQAEVKRIADWHIASKPIRDALRAATWVVLLALASFTGWQLLLYFVFAPLAQGRAPLVIDPGRGQDPSGVPDHACGVSLTVRLQPDQELLIASGYLQRIPVGMQARTQWLLRMQHPLMSWLSDLWMLTRLRTDTAKDVVLSAAADPLDEMAQVHLAAGQSLVLSPRHLVGLVQARRQPMAIRGRWHFGWQAWWSLQFRHLVFHGPGILVLRGCRGVRVEASDAGAVVSQSLTVGFSAHLRYTVSRTETFAAYLFGQRALFNDRLVGHGIVIYQEVARGSAQSGLSARLQGLMDGVLRAFGL